MKILICDYQKPEADALAELLCNAGYEPVVFPCGKDVLEYIGTGAAVGACLTDRDIPGTEGIIVNISGVPHFIMYRDISCVEVMGHHVFFRMTDGEDIRIYSALSEYAPRLLCDGRFIQCHRSYIVNMNEAVSVSEREIKLRGGRAVPVSKRCRYVKQAYMRWISGDNGIS